MVFHSHQESQTEQTSNHKAVLPSPLNSDLIVLYYRELNIRIMKENIIQAIVAKMQRNLDSRQMAQLKTVLASELYNVEIIEKQIVLANNHKKMNIF